GLQADGQTTEGEGCEWVFLIRHESVGERVFLLDKGQVEERVKSSFGFCGRVRTKNPI
ncbi:hypothetical protein U1Q18_028251, partial [Sarracenia purpurea var. burkii]